MDLKDLWTSLDELNFQVFHKHPEDTAGFWLLSGYNVLFSQVEQRAWG